MHSLTASMHSLTAAVAAEYHGVRAAIPLDLLPGRNPVVIGYSCRQPPITPRPFLPLFPTAGSTRLLYRTTLPYQTPAQVGCARLTAVRRLAECADNTTSAASTANLPKWSANGK